MANAWKIARKNNAQLPLVIVIALALVLVLLGKAQPNLFDHARSRLTDVMAPPLEVARAPLRGFDRFMGSITDIFSVYRQNLALKEENARLRQWRNVAIVLQGRVNRYQTLLHAVPDPKLNSVLARVIGRASRPFLRTMILDAGKRHKVMPGQAVMDARGMIGRIYLTGERTSWVILLTDLNSRVPVTIASAGGNGNVQAMMTGDNSQLPILSMVSRIENLRAGDQVVSSGDGGFLPAGLPIGTVVEDRGTWRVSLLADPASSQDVEVLNFSQPPEALPPSAQLPAEAAGLKPLAPPPPPLTAATPPVAAKPGVPANPQVNPQPNSQANPQTNQTAPADPNAEEDE